MTRQVGVGVGEGINLFLEMLVIQAFFPLEYLSYMFLFSFASGVNLSSGCQQIFLERNSFLTDNH